MSENVKPADAVTDAELVRPYDVDRRCPECGAKLTVQIFPQGFEAHCTPCRRRARSATSAE